MPESSLRPPRIAIIDDHALVRTGLAHTVREELGAEVVHLGADPAQVLALAPLPDLLLLDLDLGAGQADPRVAGAIQAAGCHVIVVSAMADRELIKAMIEAGVAGFVSKGEPAEVLVAAVRQVLEEGTWTSPEVAAILAAGPVRPHLSATQQQVLVLYASGLKAVTVARQLGISVGTVQTHLKRARAKYAEVGRPTSGRIDLYREVVRDGLLDNPDSPRG